MSRAATMPRPGDVVAGKYAIERVLGEGGMGVVYEATHLRLRQRVALKMLLPEMLDHPVLVERFEREGQAAAKLRSRHAVRVLDVDVTPDGLPYLVMELLSGRDLASLLLTRGKLPASEAVDLVLQACAAMAEAHHAGIVHRDLKPSNLFLADEPDGRVVKVVDFGISKVMTGGDVKLTSAEAVMGTALYMSPEQVHDAGEVDARTDVWALGVILYELLTGSPPWVGPAVSVAAAIVVADPPPLPDVPQALQAIVLRCLAKPLAERYQDVRQLAAALADFAPPTSLGRAAADALAKGSTPRFTIEPPRPVLNSMRPVEGATAAGWTQGGKTASSASPMLVALGVAFVLGLVVLGGGFFAWTRMHAEPAAQPPQPQPQPQPPPPPQPQPQPPPSVASAEPAPAPTPIKSAARAPSPKASSTPARPPAPPPPAPAPEPTNPLTL